MASDPEADIGRFITHVLSCGIIILCHLSESGTLKAEKTERSQLASQKKGTVRQAIGGIYKIYMRIYINIYKNRKKFRYSIHISVKRGKDDL